jgi:hypothetical protein
MEARVAHLESDVGHIKSDISEIKEGLKSLGAFMSDARVDIGVLKERVTHLPTKTYIGTAVGIGVGAVIVGITFLSRFGLLVTGVPTH